MNTVDILRPGWLAVALVVLAAWLAWRQVSGRRDAWAAIVEPHLLRAGYLLGGAPARLNSRRRRSVALLIAGLICLGLAGPAVERGDVGVYRNLAATVVAIDVSQSMLATDGEPTRLTTAKRAATRLLDAARGRQIALIAYAGGAHLLMPFTTDTETGRALVGVLTPDLMPTAGSRPTAALQFANALFAESKFIDRNLTLISDGSGVTEATLAAAGELAAAGVTVNVIGVGTEIGATPAGKPGPVLKADLGALNRLAAAGDGSIDTDESVGRWMDALIGLFWFDAGNGLVSAAASSVFWWDMSHWIALALLPLVLLLFRRGA